MKIYLFCYLLLFSCLTYSQEEIMIDGQPCPVHGSAKPGSNAFYLNEHKNRFQFPGVTDFYTAITLKRLLKSSDPNEFSEEKAALISGYVYDIKVGGVETCNCKTKDPNFRDTHIELVADLSYAGPENRVIAEVTPRLRALMANKEDWSTFALRKKYLHRKVQVEGWLTYDGEHELEAYANDPQNAVGRNNWRGTCWEIHPITSIKLIDESTDVDSTIPSARENKYEQPAEKRSHLGFWVGVAIVIVLLIIIYFLLKKLL